MALGSKIFLLGVTISFLSSASIPAEPSNTVHILRTPDGGVQPQVVVDGHGTVHLVYLKGQSGGWDVYYTRRARGESTFSLPNRVNNEPGSAIAIGAVRGAQLAIGSRDRVHVVWNGSQPAQEPGAKGAPMLYTRLDSSGNHFEPQRNLMTSTMNLDGGGSVAADAKGNVFVVWHAHSKSGPVDESHRAVYLALSTDEGRTFAPERKINTGTNGVCGCCGLKAFADNRDRLTILYRSADEVGNRDSILLLSTDLGQTFQSRLLAKWHSPTCPMSTPSLGQGPGNTIAAMWETTGQIYRGFNDPAQFGQDSQSDAMDGNPGGRKHPTFAMSQKKSSRMLIAWTEGTGWEKGGTLAWESVDLNSGDHSSGTAPGIPVWGLPAVVPEPDGTFTVIY
jgi:hypothetical protein